MQELLLKLSKDDYLLELVAGNLGAAAHLCSPTRLNRSVLRRLRLGFTDRGELTRIALERTVDRDGVVIPTRAGCTFTGTEVADWLQAATIALVGEIPLTVLREAVPASPHTARPGSVCSSAGAHRRQARSHTRNRTAFSQPCRSQWCSSSQDAKCRECASTASSSPGGRKRAIRRPGRLPPRVGHRGERRRMGHWRPPVAQTPLKHPQTP